MNCRFQENIGDRFGFHHVMMSVSLWPTILIMIADVWRDKRPVTRDVEDRLYSKLAYLVTKVSSFCSTARGAVAQLVERPLKVPVWCNSADMGSKYVTA